MDALGWAEGVLGAALVVEVDAEEPEEGGSVKMMSTERSASRGSSMYASPEMTCMLLGIVDTMDIVDAVDTVTPGWLGRRVRANWAAQGAASLAVVLLIVAFDVVNGAGGLRPGPVASALVIAMPFRAGGGAVFRRS